MFSFVSSSFRRAVLRRAIGCVIGCVIGCTGLVALVGSSICPVSATSATSTTSTVLAAGTTRVTYRPPVPGPIVDNWRPPEHPYGAGNLGIDFYARAGDPVSAAANGVVTFAGRVGRSLFVVILHADGLRTTIGFVQSILVPRGAQVTRGAVVAIAAGPVHFGVRQGSTYLDPRLLFFVKVWLVQ